MGIDLLAHDRDVCVVGAIMCILYHTCVRIGTSMALTVYESESQEQDYTSSADILGEMS